MTPTTKTLTRFLIEEQRRFNDTSGGLTALINDVRLACKRIANLIGKGGLAGALGNAGSQNVQGETQMKLDVMANDIFVRTNEWGGRLAGMLSEEMEVPYPIPVEYPRGEYLLLFDPLDGSSNIDVNVAVGSIFSGSVVASTNLRYSGGSSSVFSIALNAVLESMCTSSTMKTLKRPCTGL